jgi:hypothetical protein
VVSHHLSRPQAEFDWPKKGKNHQIYQTRKVESLGSG